MKLYSGAGPLACYACAMSFPFRQLLEADKLVAGSPVWSDPEGTDQKTKLIAALMVEGRVFRGLELIGRASQNFRNANMSFSLVYLPTDNRRDAVQMARVDWRPLTPHTNDHPSSPPHLLGLEIDNTHHHSFDLNWSTGTGKPLKWLPIAEPIEPDFANVAQFIDGVGRFFRIGDPGSALTSPWPTDLFDL